MDFEKRFEKEDEDEEQKDVQYTKLTFRVFD